MKKPIAIEKFFDAVFLSCRNKSRESAHEKRKRKVWKDYCRLRWTSVDTTAPDQNLDHGPDKLGSTVRPSMASIDSGVRGLNKENRRRRTSMILKNIMFMKTMVSQYGMLNISRLQRKNDGLILVQTFQSLRHFLRFQK